MLEQISSAERERWLRLGYTLGMSEERACQFIEGLPLHIRLTERERRLNRLKYGKGDLTEAL